MNRSYEHWQLLESSPVSETHPGDVLTSSDGTWPHDPHDSGMGGGDGGREGRKWRRELDWHARGLQVRPWRLDGSSWKALWCPVSAFLLLAPLLQLKSPPRGDAQKCVFNEQTECLQEHILGSSQGFHCCGIGRSTFPFHPWIVGRSILLQWLCGSYLSY